MVADAADVSRGIGRFLGNIILMQFVVKKFDFHQFYPLSKMFQLIQEPFEYARGTPDKKHCHGPYEINLVEISWTLPLDFRHGCIYGLDS